MEVMREQEGIGNAGVGAEVEDLLSAGERL